MARFSGAFFLAAALLLVGGCSSSLYISPRSAVVSDLTLAQKQHYIHNAASTLKNFRSIARELNGHKHSLAREDFGEEVQRYIKLQVDPIVRDPAASTNPRTRLEVAKLQLLCSQLYLELGKGMESWQELREMERRYSGRPAVLQAPIDPRELGCSNLAEGIRVLKKRLSFEAFSHALSPSS